MSEAITKGILRGGQQLYEGAGSALQYLGNRIGNADLAEFGKEHAARGREVGEWFEPSRDIAKSYFGEDSTDRPGAKLAYDIANMGVSMAPALIAAGATMGSSLVPPAASRLVASIVGGAIGGMQEGTSTYQEMMKRGAPESDAARGLESMAAGAGILNAISMGKILSKSSGGVIGAIKKGLASGVTEATTEYLEEPLEVGIKKNLLKPEQFTEKEARDQLIGGFDVMPASFVLGALTGGIAGLSRSAPSPPSPTARDYARTPADEKAAYQEYFERPAADPASLVSGANNLYNNLIAKKASPDQQLTGDEQALISLLAQIKDDPREVAKYYGLRLPMRNETPADHGTIVEYLSRKQAEQEASKATAQAATQEAPPAPPPVDLESQGIPTGPVNITAPSNPLFGYPSDTEAAQLAAQNQAFNQGQAEMTGDIEAEKILRQQVPREIAREQEAANLQGVEEGFNEAAGLVDTVEAPEAPEMQIPVEQPAEVPAQQGITAQQAEQIGQTEQMPQAVSQIEPIAEEQPSPPAKQPLPPAVQETIAMYSRKPATRVSEVQLQETAKAVGAEVFVDRGAFGTDRVRVRIGNERKGFRDIRSAYDYLSSELNKSVSESKEQPVKSRTESALSIISTIYSKAKANPAGFTIDISDGSMVEKGYAVAPAKETATVFDDFTEQDARGFLRRFKPVFDSDDRAFFGGWMADDPKSPDYGKFVLDVSFVVDNFEDAAYIADIGEQDGIYNIDGPDPEARYIRTEDAIRTLKERGVYDEGKRAKLAGIRGRLHQIIKGEGVAERTASEPGAPAYSRAVLDNGRVSPQRSTLGQGTQGNLPAPIQVTGVHFSKEQRPVLSTSYAGTNYAGAEKTRLSTAPKEIQPRLYIYANVGYGINPEIGVGPHAHKLTIDNLHDFRSGGLDYEILPGENSNNAFEMAVLKAGYNGWFDRASGVICVLGKQKLIPEYLGVNREAYTNITQAPPMKITREMELNEIIANSDDIPQGYISGPRWVKEIQEELPAIYPELEAMGIIEALRNYPDTLSRREIMAVKKIKPGRYSRSEEQPSQQLSRSDLQTLANDLLGTSRNRPGLIIVDKPSDLPFDALEDAEGVFYDGKIYLVSSNIPTVEDAKRVIFHELVGHYGLRGFFGNRLDSTLDLIYNNNPLVRQYALDWMKNNRDLQLRYELSDLDYHYRAIEEAMAKMAQQNKPFSFAKRLLSTIQSLLRKVGLNKLADTLEAKSNAEALAILDKSRLYISKGAAIDSKMPSPAFAYFSRAPRKITPKSEKKPRKTLRDITDLEPPHATAPLPTIPPEQISDWMKDNSLYALSQFKQMLPKNTPELSILERLLASPEWYQHPIFRNLVDLFSNQRHDIANKIFQDNEMIDPTMPVSDKNSLIAAAKSLKNKGLSNMDIFRGKSSREYDALKWVITYGDAEYIRNKKEPLGIQMKKFEDHVREKLSKQRFTSAQINEIMNTWKLFRRSYDSYLKLMMAPMIEMRDKIKYASKSEGKETDLYKKLDTDLSYMINQMNSWSGFYAPRERLPGKWVVYGLKGEGDKEKRFREHVGTRFEAEKLKDRYERMGYTVQPITEYNQMPEIVMQNLRQTHITQAIKNAIQSEKAKSKGNQDKIDLLNQLNQGVLNQVADIIQARGYLSSKMARITEHHITGYIEDPIERYLIYARNTSNGLAKSQVSQTAYEVLRHIDPMKSADENRLYNAASKYIEDNLRNIDKADRAVALAKSAATMKYLALNPRSLLVNATAVATTAPAAIHQYATGGKIGLHKIVASLASAGADFGKFMAGNRNFSKEEQQFLNDLIRSHYDNPQYTMDIMGNLQGSGSKLWNTAMRWGMTPFSLSERWNRGTTMLAAFRLARSQGKSYEEASKLARIASDKAHGIYGKATLPEIAQGTTLVARAAQMMYSYAKFGHNYVQMLYDLGFRKQNLQAFAYALLSPVVLAGGASLPFKDNIVYTVNWILRFLGIKEDSEKWWWDQTRKYLGKEGEKLGRHGIIGYMGADISSSLSINLGIPDTYSKLAGPVGGVAEDFSNVKKYTQTGEYSKAAESVLPNAVTNMLRAYRERQEGVTSRQGRRLWDESGKPFIPTTGQALLRATGFRPSEQAMLQERKFESQRVYDTFKEAHDNILEAIRAYLISPVKNPEKMVRITRQIEKYNQQVTSQGLVDQVPLITRNSIMTQLRGVSAPKKKEAARLRSQTL